MNPRAVLPSRHAAAELNNALNNPARLLFYRITTMSTQTAIAAKEDLRAAFAN